MKTSITFFSALLFTTLNLSACGDSSGGGGGEEPKKNGPTGESQDDPNGDQPGDQPGQALTKDCETQWKEKIANAIVGEVKVYDYNEVTTGSGDLGLDGTVRTRSRDEVISATDAGIEIATVTEYFEPNLGKVEGKSGMTKETFFLICEPMPDDVKPDPDAMAKLGITVLIERDESITVKAGTFAVHYEKIQVKNDDGFSSDVLSDHWTMKNGTIVVKENFVVTSKTEGSNMVKTSERELIEYIAP